jgi:PAS domain S-box-containing protein
MFVSGMSSALILSLVFIFLFIRDKKVYLGIIASGWSIFFIHKLLGLFSMFNYIKSIAALRNVLYLISIFIFIYGMYSFIQQSMKKAWIVAFVVGVIYIIIANSINMSYVLQNIVFVIPGSALICSAKSIIKSKKNMKIGEYIVGCDFILWGIQLITFPFLGNIVSFIPIGNFIASLIFNIFAFGNIALYFETILLRLDKSEERYKLLVELSPDAIGVVIDEEIVFANNASLKLLRTGRIEDIQGHNLKEFLYPDYIQYGQERFEQLFFTKKDQPPNEIKIKALDGTVIDVESSIALFPYKDKMGILGIARDITERKNAERLKKRIEEKTRLLKETQELDNLRNDFFANISHELRTPLNIILGSIQLFEMNNERNHEKGCLNDRKYIKVIKQNCNRLLKLVNNLIDITKIDTGFYNTNFQNHNIVSIVENITLSVVDYVANKDIELIFDTDIEEKIIACDPDKIERIILNLLSNAIKFTSVKGHILVKINDCIDNISISIRDDGVGIPKDKQELVFERFKQVENTLSRSNEGSGIGLSLVKSLVEMHRGSIAVESKYGEGTEFIISLPVRTIEEENTIDESKFSINNTLIERISIEFSDIYEA